MSGQKSTESKGEVFSEKPLNILIIDDDQNLRQSLQEILLIHGYATEGVSSGADAIDLISKTQYTAALIDLELADMPGLDVLAAIKEASPDTECIILTGFASAESAIRAVNLGAYSYVQKPYDVDQLMLTIRRALEKKQDRQALSKAELRYRQLYESAKDGIVTVDLAGAILEFNSTFQQMVGYTPEELTGMEFWKITPRKWFEMEKTILKDQVLKRGYSDIFEKEYIHKDGHIFPIEVSAFLNIDQQGKPASMWAFVRDISERKQGEATLRRQLQEVTVLHSVASAANEAESVDDLIERATKILGETIFSDYFGVNIYDESRHWLMPHSSYRGMDKGHKQQGSSADEGITGRALRSGKPQLVGDVSRDKDYISFQEITQSEIAVPIIVNGKKIGVMNAESEQKNSYTHQDLNLMVTIANQLGTAIHKIHLEEHQHRHTQHIEALYETALAISSLTDTASLYQKLYQQVNNLFDLEAFFLARADMQAGKIEFVHVVKDGVPVDHLIAKQQTIEESGLTGWIIQNKSPFFSADIRQNQLPAKPVFDKTPFRSFMGVPLIAKGAVIGSMSIQSYQPNLYSQEQLRMLELLASQAAIALENASLLDQSRRQIERLTSLHDIDMVINSSLDLRVTLNILLDQVVDKLTVDAAAVLLLNSATQMLEYMAGRGFRTGSIERYKLRMGEGISGQAAMERHLMQALNLDEMQDDQTYTALMQTEGFETYFSVPLIAKGQVKGVLDIFNRTPLNPEKDWFDFLETLGAQAAIAIDNTTLLEDLQRSNVDLTLAYDTTLEGWSRALDMRDEETEGHTHRVADLTINIATELGLSDEEIIQIRRDALLHDIGKMGIPDEILHKPGPLTEEEWHIMRTHPLKAFDMLSPIAFLRPALDIPYCHHEKYDGSGYPAGLKGEQIPLAARIFSLADVYDALTSDRPYRKAWSQKKALDYIKEQNGKHFDPAIVDIFLRIIKNELIHHDGD